MPRFFIASTKSGCARTSGGTLSNSSNMIAGCASLTGVIVTSAFVRRSTIASNVRLAARSKTTTAASRRKDGAGLERAHFGFRRLVERDLREERLRRDHFGPRAEDVHDGGDFARRQRIQRMRRRRRHLRARLRGGGRRAASRRRLWQRSPGGGRRGSFDRGLSGFGGRKGSEREPKAGGGKRQSLKAHRLL